MERVSNRSVSKILPPAVLCLVFVLMAATAAFCNPYFRIDTEVQWEEGLSSGKIRPVMPPEWAKYMDQWRAFLEEGKPYPSSQFIPPELYVWPGGGSGGLKPEDAGLVMVWGTATIAPGQYSSAWKFDYQLDPDLTNSTITVTVTAPQFDMNGNQISTVSFGIQDINGNVRAWHWNVGPAPAPIQWNVPTTITINTALVGLGAANPVATGYMSNPGFNLAQSQFFIVDENCKWVGGPAPVPPPGQTMPRMWNYWHNLIVTPNIPPKGTDPIKWSQPVVEYEPGLDPPVFIGWDEKSLYNFGPPMVADDWLCQDARPVTDIHWWGSFINWDQPYPPQLPVAFHIGVWTDVKPGTSTEPFSHPGTLIWENFCDTYQWNFAGYDHDPRGQTRNEACFQFNQKLKPEEWFYQDPTADGTVYWLSIAAIYEQTPRYPWGWKTRPHFFNDDAVRIWQVFDPSGMTLWPPRPGYMWAQGQPIEFPAGTSWDLAFELTTIEEPRDIDWGDAPDPTYPTLAASNGASHVITSNLFLGNLIDAEPDGQPNATATGDDNNNLADEDGVISGSALIPGQPATVTIRASASGRLDGWLDYNANGSWADAGEQVFTSQPLAGGDNTLTFTVPSSAVVGQTFARLRFSSAGGLSYTGPAPDGEVEDYEVRIEPPQPNFDFGDAPDPTYPTLAASAGANHMIVPGMMLGTAIDPEPDGQPNAAATGDDLAGVDDEDGVVFTSPLIPGGVATLNVTASVAGMLDAWIDFNGDGDWADPGEQVFASQPLAGGVNALAFPVPATAVFGNTFARFRFSKAGGLSYTGPAPDGEVEDYLVTISCLYKHIDTQNDWDAALSSGKIMPVMPHEWDEYMMQWQAYLEEGERYPSNQFIPAELYVWPGGGSGGLKPEDAGLVMVWRAPAGQVGEFSSAWKFDYQADPDLSNSTITVTVTAPQFDMNGNQINTVSFGIQDVNGLVRAWHWNVGPAPAPIQWNVPTTITINTALVGLGAANPVATGYMSNPGFNLAQSQFFIVDENCKWVGGPTPVPPPGQTMPGMWNYWHNLIVTPNIPPKGTDPTKWSQPPVIYKPGDPPIFLGWDEKSLYNFGPPMAADDWECRDQRPVTDIHWWGSFLDWTQPCPPQLPVAFHIGIWTDVTAGPAFSHPGKLIWDNYCYSYEWNFAGFDYDPCKGIEGEACFQFNQKLKPDEWFYQDPGPDGKRIYWLSISAIYDETPRHPWGWKTRPHFFNDDAVRIWQVFDPDGTTMWPPTVGSTWAQGQPIHCPDTVSWDLAFELTTNEVLREFDWGDAPDPTYPTLAASTGANHVIVPGFFLGAQIDAEADGQPDAAATGDDLANLADEDGVVFTTPLVPGGTATITVTASAAGMLDAWVDFNIDGDWADPGEQIFASQALAAGGNILTFMVPSTAVLGNTFARFRFSKAGGLSYTGSAPDGEVEDYQVSIACLYKRIDTQNDWDAALSSGKIRPVMPPEWSEYMAQWRTYLEEGEPYPSNQFIPAELYVWGGGGSGEIEPEDAGLVMVWRAPAGQVGEFSSAWKFDYQADPDLSNSTITVTVTAPQFDMNGNQINTVSLGIQDVNGLVRAWHWNVGPAPAPIQWNVPTTITINTALVGLGAANPVATGYMSAPGFNLAQSQFFIVDENCQWVGGLTPVPPPGQTMPGMWNYWHNLIVTPNIPPKGTDPTKWSQPPVIYKPGDPPIFLGWDEKSLYNFGPPMAADDWECRDQRPVTDIHWWGSFLDWTQPCPPQLPVAFHIGIWTDVPAGGAAEPFSHPGKLIWDNYCYSYEWNFAGFDYDPCKGIEGEACFQFNQKLNTDEWFHQDPGPDGKRIYWLSISAIYQETPRHPWGWKTRPHFFQDDAVRIWVVDTPWPPTIGSNWSQGQPILCPDTVSWDLAFELTTNEVLREFDWGDAPDPTYPTLAASTGANHLIVPGFFLGAQIDAEADGQPNAAATGDDIAGVDDEDGVVFATPLVPGGSATVDVTASAAGMLDAWIDYNADGDWADPGEQVFASAPLAAGLNSLAFIVPAGATIGNTFARFRFSSTGGLPYTGAASDGEIEDYQVGIVCLYKRIDTQNDWEAALSSGKIRPVMPHEWDEYMAQWRTFREEGEPYPSNQFIPAELYVWPGGGSGGIEPEDAGLVMVWRAPAGQVGEFSSAWMFDYQADPDLSNSTITVTVTAPQFDFNGNQINTVSFGIQDVNGLVRAWHWNVGPAPAPIQWNVPTTITINTALVGLGAANPVATGYMSAPGFNLAQSQFFIVDENCKWVGGPTPVPPPGQTMPGMWNYWHNLIVTPNIPPKGTDPTKWSQPPVIYKPGDPPTFLGWDEKSLYNFGPPMAADDWECRDNRPVTDIHWWGSFLDWTQPCPPQLPVAFHIGIWTDVTAGPAFSHPGKLIWDNYCYSYEWNFAGFDYDPCKGIEGEACFQFNQKLNTDEWFYQDPGPDGKRIYWLSISAIYDETPRHPWGWKTRPHFFNDDAVRIWQVFDPDGTTMWPPTVGSTWAQGQPIHCPDTVSWDLAFELTTNEVLREFDWGDAPDPTYPTLAASGGANHLILPGFFLGAQIDAEADGQPDAAATGDDLAGLDDEDGVVFNTALFPGVPATITVTASGPGLLQGWIDFNGDGDWADAGEQILTDVGVVAGSNTLRFFVPNIAAVCKTYARFRLSSVAGLSYTGGAPDGEVEDYEVQINALKWLQKPDLTTTGVDVDNFWVQEADDFRCTVTGPITDIHIWTSFAGDRLPPEGLNSLGFKLFIYSDVPDPDPTDPKSWSHPGELLWSKTFDPGTYNAGPVMDNRPEWWHDPATNFWTFPGDTQVFQYDFRIDPTEAFWQRKGTIYWLGVKYQEQTGSTLGWKTSLEHWNDDACWLDTSGPALVWKELRYGGNHPLAGQSMDLAFAMTVPCQPTPQEFDWGDAPDPTYPTLAASNGANHVIVPGFFLGAQIDAEADGQPNAAATGDDLANLDDEDGVVIPPLIAGLPRKITVTASAPGMLDGWIDYNADGDWADPGEQVFASTPLAAGLNVLVIVVPAGAGGAGPVASFARFRFSSAGGLSYTGPAADGEVEDYGVRIYPKPIIVTKGRAKWLPLGSYVLIQKNIVTANPAVAGTPLNAWYFEEPDRSAGLGVLRSPNEISALWAIGDVVSCYGQTTLVGCELMIEEIDSWREGTATVKPLGQNNRDSGGSDFGNQPGVTAMTPSSTRTVGLNTVGLLVELWGRCTYVETQPGDPTVPLNFWIDDGSNLWDGTVSPLGPRVLGVKVRAVQNAADPMPRIEVNRYYTVTGIMRAESKANGCVRWLWPRTGSDVRDITGL